MGLRRNLITLLVGAIVVSLGACSPTTGGTGGPIDGTAWKLTSYAVAGTSTPVPGDVFVDAQFAGGTVAGSSGATSTTVQRP